MPRATHRETTTPNLAYALTKFVYFRLDLALILIGFVATSADALVVTMRRYKSLLIEWSSNQTLEEWYISCITITWRNDTDTYHSSKKQTWISCVIKNVEPLLTHLSVPPLFGWYSIFSRCGSNIGSGVSVLFFSIFSRFH